MSLLLATLLAIAPCDNSTVITALEHALREHYVFAETGSRIAGAIEAKRSAYEKLDAETLAATLTHDLNAIASDKHLRVAVAQAPAVSSPRSAAESDRARRNHFGFRRVEMFPGGVGYLDLTEFDRPNDTARNEASAAFAQLKNAGAMVIDLRANGGGNPDMVALISAYVLDQPTLLAEMHHRENGTEPLWSPPRPSNALQHGVPLYLLTSHDTFSAGEGFAFILQHLGRATVVGERTAGAAHAGRGYPLPCGFEADIPNTSIVLPGTHADWEGRGVTPDVPAPAADALRVARALAAQRHRPLQ